jgi:hypothetical protein
VALDKYSSTAHLTWLSQKPWVMEKKILTYLNSALKVLLGTDIFRRVPKKVKFCCPVKYVQIYTFFTFNLAVTKKPRVMEKNYLRV